MDESRQIDDLRAHIEELERSRAMLWALERASEAMAAALEPTAVFDAIGTTLAELGVQVIVLGLDPDGETLRLVHMSVSSTLVQAVEQRVGIGRRGFVVPYPTIPFYKAIIDERRAVFERDTFEIAKSVLPDVAAPMIRFILDRLGMSQMIGAPLIVDGRVWGALVISSAQLAADDLAAVSVFAHQVGGSLHKTRLLTELGDALARMEATQAQLVQAQKMEALGQLTGGIAHDLNNLLTGILMSCELAQDDLPERSPVREEIEDIVSTSRRASVLIKQLLAFSRRQVLRPRIADLCTVVRDLEPLLRRVIGEDIDLRIEIHDDAPKPTRIDVPQLEQVIMNLVVNARDAMPRGGKLSLRTRYVVDDAHAPADARGIGLVCLSVSDTGEGITPEVRGRIFDPFFTTKPRGRGTGLGLSVAYGILRQHNGWLTVQSEVGVGTQFHVWLPVATDDAGDADEPSGAAASVDPMRRDRRACGSILLVEDEHELRRAMIRSLEREGFELCVAATVAEAKTTFDRTRPRVVVSDVVLPDGSGLDLCEELYRQRPAPRIVLVSGYTDRRVDVGAIERRGWVFLAKPFSPQELLTAIEAALTASASGRTA